MTPWTNAYIDVISKARLFARAWDSVNSITASMRNHSILVNYYHRQELRDLMMARANLEMACAQYRAELVKGVL